MTKRLFLTAAGAAAFLLAAPAGAQVSLPGSPTEEGASIQATGIVQASTQQDAFTLRVRSMSFRVLYQPGPGQRRQEVRTGDRVRVNGDLTAADQIRADSVLVLQRGGGGGGPRQPRTVVGTIRRIDREQREMRVTTTEGSVRVSWDENTEFVRNTTRSGSREFSVGDAVRIAGRRTSDGDIVARRVMYGGRPGWANGGVGEIVGIDSRAREIDVDFDGEVWTVRLNTAQLRRRDQRIQIDDLRIGQDVRVSGSGRGTRAVDASLVEVVRGDRD